MSTNTNIVTQFKVNTLSANIDSRSSSVSLSDGSVVITWLSANQSGSNFGIYGQRYSSDGTTLGSQFKINTTNVGQQNYSTIEALADGGFVVTWLSANQNGSGFSIYGQRYNSSGVAFGAQFKVNTITINKGYENYPSVVALADGGFFVAWESNYDIYAQYYSSTNVAVGTHIVLDSDYFRSANPALNQLSEGTFVAVWEQDRGDYDDYDIRGQIFNEQGIKLGNELVIMRGENNESGSHPNVIGLSDGSFLVMWSSIYEGRGFTIQRFNSNGQQLALPPLSDKGNGYFGVDPKVTTLANGGFVLTWTRAYSLQAYGPSGIYGMLFDSPDDLEPKSFLASPVMIGDMRDSSVTALSDGGFIVTWTSYLPSNQGGDGYNIYAQRFNANGDTVSLAPPSANQAPVTGDDQYSIGLGEEAHIFDILLNDSDPENDTLTLVSADNIGVLGISVKIISINNNKIQYVLEDDFYGIRNDVITYIVQDAQGNQTQGKAYITIQGNNQPPVAVDDVATTRSNQPITVNVVANDYDNDGDNIILLNASVSSTAGTVVIGQEQSNYNQLVFTPKAGFVGQAVIEYHIRGIRSSGFGDDTDTGRLVVTVKAPNYAPILEGHQLALNNGVQNTPYILSASELLQGFIDIDGDSLTVINLQATNGSLINHQNGTYTFTPNTNFYGAVNLSYQVTDGQGGITNAVNSFVVNQAVNTIGTTDGDILKGGQNDDVYIINHVRDVVIETDINGGIDTVQTSLSYNLTNNIENLVLVGNANLSATGNNLDNQLSGNNGKNYLFGGMGNDTLKGDAGGDTLEGGVGADVMYGGTGNDTFSVENIDDVVIELTNEGYDTVNSFITYHLSENVERLNLENAGGQIDGSGNDLDNTLNGNDFANYLVGGAGNDVLQGKAGTDTLEGGFGDDVYYVDNIGDVIAEFAGEGIDKVNSSVSYTLTANVEQLFLTGIAALSGTGNAENNIVYGNDGNNQLSGNAGNDSLNGGLGNDTLDGGVGNDTLVGGLGNDSYLFDIGSGRDIIDNKDSVGNDVLLLGVGITAEQVWLRQTGNDLELSIIGTANSIKVKAWYGTDATSKIDSVQLSDGRSLLATEVQVLVEAMAAFALPPLGQTTLTAEQQNTLGAVIAATW